MFKNYLHIALRNILKQKVISFINILGLAIGIAISISLIIGTILIFNQLRYIQNKNLGFNKDQLVVLDTSSITSHYVFKNELLKHHNIVGVSVASSVPPNPYHFSGAETVGEPEEKHISVKNLFVDYDYIKLLFCR